ncbi:MAG: sulfotransferase family 2 domain-containing protein [Pseudomonadota bacterium]
MTGPFRSFVIFAEMRTGSNFLEANLNALSTVACHGEAFNTNFIGYPNNAPILGVDQQQRDDDPLVLLEAIRTDVTQLSGFRYFHDHDPRVFGPIMSDVTCAKIILTRNPVESFVSWKIAQATGQWKLQDLKARKSASVDFDIGDFEKYVQRLQAFQMRVRSGLQTSGQTAFHLGYDDLKELDVINGLVRFLGLPDELEALDTKLKKQNPSPLSALVRNYDDMRAALAGFDPFDLDRTPYFEPRRGPNVPSYVAAAQSPLLFLPIKGGPQDRVIAWMAQLDNVALADLKYRMKQKALRSWKRNASGHRSFTVLRHPVARAHAVFCEYILNTEQTKYLKIRHMLRRRYHLPLPENACDQSYDVDAHRTAFKAFVRFLKGNLAGQTAIRVDGAWCTQSQSLAGFGELCFPDHILREDELERDLAALATSIGHLDPPIIPAPLPDEPISLAQIYDDEVEALVADVYQRDYLNFGFSRWA